MNFNPEITSKLDFCLFESLDDVWNYTYTYPVEEWVMGEFRKRKKKQEKT